MSNEIPTRRRPRVLFMGLDCITSLLSVQALLQSEFEVCAIVTPSTRELKGAPALLLREQPRYARASVLMFPSSTPTSMAQLAWARKIPLLEVARIADPVTVSTLAAYQPDAICVACFSQRLPPALLTIPPLGCLNVHPSLLPANRGPEPLFWAFYLGLQEMGVTVYLMDEDFDSGPMLAQEKLSIPDGSSYADLEYRSAILGGKLLVASVWKLATGQAVLIPQDETRSSYDPFPSTEHFIVPVAAWHARHAYNFVHGVQSWAEPLSFQLDARRYRILRAVAYTLDEMDTRKMLSDLRGDELWVKCKTGWLNLIVTAE